MYSLCFLAAACVSGVTDPPAGGCAQCAAAAAQPAAGQQAPGTVYYQVDPDAGTLRARWRHMLGLQPRNTYTVVNYPTRPAQPRTMETMAPPMGASGTTVTTALRPGFDIPKELEGKLDLDKAGHEEDYSWITGHLVYSRTGGFWVLRYARLDESDKYGGSVVLAPSVEMRNYREGDLVCVFGQVVDEGRGERHLGGPLYRPNSISLVERADP